MAGDPKDQLDNQGEELVDSSRRKFLRNTGIATGGLMGGLILGGLLGNPFTSEKESEPEPITDKTAGASLPTEAMQFFTRKEDFDTAAAAAEVIYPEDEHGPGAIGLGVPYYIDKQLVTPWGRNADDYMKRPFRLGETPLTRGEIMLKGLRKLNAESLEEYQVEFKDLEENAQIALLQRFEAGDVKMNYVSSAGFFALLRQLTIEGCYADPMYGGNKDMAGWKMKEFPGAHMSYRDVIESDEFVYKEPISLSDHM